MGADVRALPRAMIVILRIVTFCLQWLGIYLRYAMALLMLDRSCLNDAKQRCLTVCQHLPSSKPPKPCFDCNRSFLRISIRQLIPLVVFTVMIPDSCYNFTPTELSGGALNPSPALCFDALCLYAQIRTSIT